MGWPGGREPLLPKGERIYAVGDIHGRADCLDAMLALIGDDLLERPHPAPREIFLGDYVDRGPQSPAVLNRLLKPVPGRPRLCLKGNHEDTLLGFLADSRLLAHWLRMGGLETLRAYGVGQSEPAMRANPEACRAAFCDMLPPAHRLFLSGLPTCERRGGTLFVHAGIRPGTPLEQQDEQDLIWIREPFLNAAGPLPVRVVHGHTPVRAPEVHRCRINVDTMAFATGRLSCAVLEADSVRFLTTMPDDQ